MPHDHRRVFAVQRHQVRRGAGFQDKYDLAPALAYGTLHYLIEHHVRADSPADALPLIDAGLADFCDTDYLLLIGNPVLIGISFALAAEYNDGRVKVLQWDAKNGCYTPIAIDLGGVSE